MAKLPKAFRTKNHEPMRDMTAIPAADYKVKITGSDYVANRNKDGYILKLEFSVVGGDRNGSKLFVNLNLENQSEKAVEIANSELTTICEACGKTSIKDSKELHGILMNVKVGVRKTEAYGEQNTMQMYWEYDEDEEEEEVDKVDSEDEEIEGGDESEESEDDEDDEITAESVKALALKYKGMTNGKKLKAVLSEYDIKLPGKITELDDDDLESLKEDLEEAIENEE